MGPTIKTRLRVLRAEQEWSQAKLAAQVGVSRQTINSIEKGRYHPNLRLAFKIARVFGKRVEEVFVYGVTPSNQLDRVLFHPDYTP